jgi:hypothetical protein
MHVFLLIFEGHTMGCLNTAEDAARRGARFITHLFNAMLPVIKFRLIWIKLLYHGVFAIKYQ